MLAEPFDPFTMMIERPIPKILRSDSPPTEEGEEELKSIILIHKDAKIDRKEILERLQKNNIWITKCENPLPYTHDSQYINSPEYDELEEEEEKEEEEEEEEKEEEEKEEEE